MAVIGSYSLLSTSRLRESAWFVRAIKFWYKTDSCDSESWCQTALPTPSDEPRETLWPVPQISVINRSGHTVFCADSWPSALNSSVRPPRASGTAGVDPDRSHNSPIFFIYYTISWQLLWSHLQWLMMPTEMLKYVNWQVNLLQSKNQNTPFSVCIPWKGPYFTPRMLKNIVLLNNTIPISSFLIP